ncbi:hypothetical protein RHMOL_Rhmol10G0149600 [Rhododendron molle]|uniref:Uncharacterized protein n=1 Tax=Rhododendron molle TaxID=49168 RepID=A0ACC0M2I3_RHOML|nr:hypothetical protein RHMOL_Rhmol10G0149600 [Rhododendron molle]
MMIIICSNEYLILGFELQYQGRKEVESRGCRQCNKAVEEGIVGGGGCTLLRLVSKVDAIKNSLENDEEKVGADIVKFLSNDNPKFRYNAGTGEYEHLMAARIIDPTENHLIVVKRQDFCLLAQHVTHEADGALDKARKDKKRHLEDTLNLLPKKRKVMAKL